MNSSLVVITPPGEPLPSVDEVKQHLHVEHADDDDDIKSKIWGAIAEFEDPQLGWLGRSILERELELRLDRFCDEIPLPCGPLLLDGHPLAIAYDDAAGDEQVLADTVYRICDPETHQCRILLRRGQSWPAVSGEQQCVRIRFWAGYVDDDVRLENFKTAVKLHVEMTYDGPSEEQQKRLAVTIDRLLQPYRVYR